MNNKEKISKDKGSFGWAVLGFLIPIIGLILALLWKNKKPNNAKKAVIGTLAGSILGISMPFIIYILEETLFPHLGSSFTTRNTCQTYGANYVSIESTYGVDNKKVYCCCNGYSDTCFSDKCITVISEE